MEILDVEFEFEKIKREIFARIERLKEEWKTLWEECAGNLEAEAKALEIMLDIQLVEMEVLDDLKEFEQRINTIKNKNLMEDE
jgi:arginyl-tRNA synthetase